MSDLPQIYKAEFEVIKIKWKHMPMGILKEYMKKRFGLFYRLFSVIPSDKSTSA